MYKILDVLYNCKHSNSYFIAKLPRSLGYNQRRFINEIESKINANIEIDRKNQSTTARCLKLLTITPRDRPNNNDQQVEMQETGDINLDIDDGFADTLSERNDVERVEDQPVDHADRNVSVIVSEDEVMDGENENEQWTARACYLS